jgi:hypothetical protein
MEAVSSEDSISRVPPDEPPPFLGTWRRVYLAVLIYLGALIVSFYIFMRAFS